MGTALELKRLDYVTLSEKGPGKPEVVTEGKDCRRLDSHRTLKECHGKGDQTCQLPHRQLRDMRK